MQKSISSFIEAEESQNVLLPISHTTDGIFIRDIALQKALIAKECSVFNEKLLYFFYGSPAYEPIDTQVSTSLNALYPIGIVLDIEKCPDPDRIVALDSGAFNNGIFENYFHKSTVIEQLYIDPKKENLGKFVNTFYKNNENYLHEIVKNDIKYSPLYFELNSYIQLITAQGNTKFDKRRSRVEIQYKNDINLTQSNVLLIVLPAIFLEDTDLYNLLYDEWKTTVDTYDTYHGRQSKFFHDIEEKATKFIRERFC